MSRNSQRSLNAGWTRHENTRPAPQQHPTTVLTHAGQTITGIAWLDGRPVSAETLLTTAKAAHAAYKAGDVMPVYQQVLIQVTPGEPCAVLRLADLRRITPSEVA